jgi:AraC-like DNA-binding protein
MDKQASSSLAGERLLFVRPASLPGTELMAVYESSRHWHVFHERYALCVFQKASAGVRYRGHDEHIRDETVAVREPGETHCNTFVAKPAVFKILFVDPQVIADAARELGKHETLHFPPFSIKHDRAMFRTLRRLCASIENGRSALEQQSLFAAALVALTRHAESKPAPAEMPDGKGAVERAKAHLRELFNESVSLQELATICCMSRFHLVHAFTKQVGLSPHAYQIHIRVERARALLHKGVAPAVVAANTGFADQSHFTRHFKKIMHVTPMQYARAM